MPKICCFRQEGPTLLIVQILISVLNQYEAPEPINRRYPAMNTQNGYFVLLVLAFEALFFMTFLLTTFFIDVVSAGLLAVLASPDFAASPFLKNLLLIYLQFGYAEQPIKGRPVFPFLSTR